MDPTSLTLEHQVHSENFHGMNTLGLSASEACELSNICSIAIGYDQG